MDDFFNLELPNFVIIELRLEDVSWLEDRHLTLLNSTKTLYYLESLFISKCPKVLGHFFDNWTGSFNQFTGLRKIHLAHLPKLEEKPLCNFISKANLVRLRKLILQEVSLGDEFFRALADPAVKFSLRRLKILGLDELSDEGLKGLVNSKGCDKLRRLAISNCPRLTSETFDNIATSKL